MNLLEHYIMEIISVEDVTKEFEKFMRKEMPEYIFDEPFLKVKIIVNCYGIEKEYETYWKKSQYEKYKSKGYFMA